MQHTLTTPQRTEDIGYTGDFEVEEIHRLLQLCNGRVTNIFREDTRLADQLANSALDNGSIERDEFNQLDSMGWRIVNDYKLQCSYGKKLGVDEGRRVMNGEETMPSGLPQKQNPNYGWLL